MARGGYPGGVLGCTSLLDAKDAEDAERERLHEEKMAAIGSHFLNILNDDCISLIVEFVAAEEDESERLQDLTSLSYTCKRLATLTRPLLYQKITINAPQIADDRDDANLELFLRSIVNNPDLGKHVQDLIIDQSGGTTQACYGQYAWTAKDPVHGGRGFFDKKDVDNVYTYIDSLTKSAVFEEYPLGTYEGRLESRKFDTLGAVKDEQRGERESALLKSAFTKGDQTVLIALLIAKCVNLKNLTITDWPELQSRVDCISPTPVPELDADFLGWVMRGGFNTQRTVASLALWEKEGFTSGVLYRLETLTMDGDQFVHESVEKLKLDKALPYLSLPSLKKARLCLLDTNCVAPDGGAAVLLELPAHLDLSIGLEHLVLDYSCVFTGTLVNIIKRTYRLKTFAYNHVVEEYYHHTVRYDHIAVINALAAHAAKTLEVLILQMDFDNGWGYDSIRHLNQVRVESWTAFEKLVRLQVPIEYVLDCRHIDGVFFSLVENGEEVDIAGVDVSEVAMDIPFHEQFPASLKQLEVLSGSIFHPRFFQLYTGLAELVKRGGAEHGSPKLERIFIPQVFGVLSRRRRVRSSPELVEMLRIAEAHGVAVHFYEEGCQGLASDPEGPAERVVDEELVGTYILEWIEGELEDDSDSYDEGSDVDVLGGGGQDLDDEDSDVDVLGDIGRDSDDEDSDTDEDEDEEEQDDWFSVFEELEI